MEMALLLAETARGQTSPNPMVGAVVVKEGSVVGFGAHLKAGEAHAEVHALDMAGEKAQGSTLYVTLEPCNHYGKTPPCTNRILSAGVVKVVVALEDPFPLVSGSGIERLRAAGIEVKVGVGREKALRQNEFFLTFVQKRRPFVTVKTAATLDGKIAARSGDSRWVTSEDARGVVHQLRHEYDAIMVGIGTVLCDNPLLTTRLAQSHGRHPLRVVVDSRLRISEDALMVQNREAPTLIFATQAAPEEKRKRLEALGVEVEILPGEQVDLHGAVKRLGERNILSVLVEGGGTLNFSLLKAGLVDKVVAFIAPKIIGGASAPTTFTGEGWEKMAQAVTFSSFQMERIGEDFCFTGYPVYKDRGAGRP